jgi:hypothetical protein
MKLTRRRIKKKTSRIKRQKLGRKTKNRRKRRRRKNGGGFLSSFLSSRSKSRGENEIHSLIYGDGRGGRRRNDGYAVERITEEKFDELKNLGNYIFLYRGPAKLVDPIQNLYIPHGENGIAWFKPEALSHTTADQHRYEGTWNEGKMTRPGIHYDGNKVVQRIP